MDARPAAATANVNGPSPNHSNGHSSQSKQLGSPNARPVRPYLRPEKIGTQNLLQVTTPVTSTDFDRHLKLIGRKQQVLDFLMRLDKHRRQFGYFYAAEKNPHTPQQPR